MTNITYTQLNYDTEFIGCLLKEVEDKIALISNKDYKNNIYNLEVIKNLGKYSDLITCKEILEKVLKCDSCFTENDIKIEDVITVVKMKLNKC